MVRYGSLYDYTIYLALLATMCVPRSSSFQPPLGEQCLVLTVHKSWEKSECEARNLFSFTEWQVLWLASFSGLPDLILITCSMQEQEGEGPPHGEKPLPPPLLHIVSDQKLEALGTNLLVVLLEEMLWYCYYTTSLAHVLQKWHIF